MQRAIVPSLFSLLTSVFALSASGAILDTDAVVSTSVQELLDGQPGSTTSDRKVLGQDAAVPRLAASASLMSTDLSGELTGLGQGFSEFSDPTRLNQPNPEEFALEVACFSAVPSVSYSVRGSVVESRRIVFATPGSELAPPEIGFEADGTREIESRVFLSGAVIVWSTQSLANLDELFGELRMKVSREGVDAPLFSSAVLVSGAQEGRVDITTEGPIRIEEVDPTTLFPTAPEVVSALGTLFIVVIPAQEHAYTYTVTADEPLVLTATLTTQVRNLPDGTGIAATLGRPFENLAAVVNMTPRVDGRAIEQSINKAISDGALGLVPPRILPVPSPRGGWCGAFGGEAATLLLIPAGLLARSSPRRRRR